MAEQAIFTVLIMVSDGSGNLLMEDRNDPGWPGICFPGGHVEPGEAFTAAAIRETIWAKPREHHFNDSSMPATRGMYRIGG